MKFDATMRLRVLAVCFFWMFPFSALSADESVNEILTKVSEAYRTLQSYELVADISTETVAVGVARSPEGGRATSNFHQAINSEVDLAAVGPEKVRLQVKDERHEVLLVSDGITRWTYLPRKKEYMEAFAYIDDAGEIFTIGADSGNRTMVAGADQHATFAWACGDGKHIAYQKRDADRSEIWRIDANGANPTLLAPAISFGVPVCSPDGQWVTFRNDDPPALFRVSIDGGKPQKIDLPGSAMGGGLPSIDGKFVLYQWQDPDNLGSRPRFITSSINGGPVVGSFERMIGGGPPVWSPDGKSLDYAVVRGGISDVWRQPLTGGPTKQFTHFTSDQIGNIAWSGDAKTLAASRGTRTADIALLKTPSKSAQ